MKHLVREAMLAQGFYKDKKSDGTEYTESELKDNFYPEATVLIRDKSYKLASIAWWDGNVFADEIDNMLAFLNPYIQELFAMNALVIFNAIRMVNVNSKQGFKGAFASGNELNLTLFRAEQFYDPDDSGNKRSTWERSVTGETTDYFFEGSSGDDALEMGEEEAMVWLGWYNPALESCVSAIQITMNTIPFDIQALDFEQVQDEVGDVIIPLKEPWTLPPEQSAYVQARYFRTGTDQMRPLGVWIKMSRNLRALASS